jgi:endonuclease G, mitochondrial
MDPDLLDWVANEGVRASKLVESIQSLSLGGEKARLRDELLTLEPPHPFEAATLAGGNGNGKTEPAPSPAPDAAPSGVTTWTIPLRVTVDLGAPARGASLTVGDGATNGTVYSSSAVAAGAPPTPRPANGAGGVDASSEAVAIDPDYASRHGYQTGFLGGNGRRVPLPRLSPAQRQKAAVNRQANGHDEILLPYHHFTLVMNRERRLAFYTAVNIDGRITHNFRRETDRWSLDPRIGADEQHGEALYAHNDLDRGHLVRRLDPAWGSSRTAAKFANDDTFHFTNCSPQHKNFNQNRTTWAGLEDYILKNADVEDLKATVFTGPVLADNDPEYRGTKLPRQFWKVVVIGRPGGGLSATAYLLSQSQLLHDLEAFTYGAYRTFQVPVAQVAMLTGLDFGDLPNSDPLRTHEVLRESVGGGGREIQHFGQIQL